MWLITIHVRVRNTIYLWYPGQSSQLGTGSSLKAINKVHSILDQKLSCYFESIVKKTLTSVPFKSCSRYYGLTFVFSVVFSHQFVMCFITCFPSVNTAKPVPVWKRDPHYFVGVLFYLYFLSINKIFYLQNKKRNTHLLY